MVHNESMNAVRQNCTESPFWKASFNTDKALIMALDLPTKQKYTLIHYFQIHTWFRFCNSQGSKEVKVKWVLKLSLTLRQWWWRCPCPGCVGEAACRWSVGWPGWKLARFHQHSHRISDPQWQTVRWLSQSGRATEKKNPNVSKLDKEIKPSGGKNVNTPLYTFEF